MQNILEKLKSGSNLLFIVEEAMDKDNLLAKFEEVAKTLKIIGEEETEQFYILHLENGNMIRVKKPRSCIEIDVILTLGKFPEKIIKSLALAKPSKCLAIVEKTMRGVILCGPAGIGKTFACIWKIADLVKYYHISNPLYISLQEISSDEYKSYKKYDAFLLDDVNANLQEWKIEFIRSIIYHAYNYCKTLFITSNLEKKALLNLLVEEPIISRLLEMCEIHEVQDRDLRKTTK